MKTYIIFPVLIVVSFFIKPFFINANNFPVEIICKNNICTCEKDKTKSLNINSVIRKLQSYEITDTVLIACVYHHLAIEYHKVSNYEKAIHYNKEAINLREKYNDGWLWKSQLYLANNFNYFDNYELSIEYLKKAKNQQGYPKRSKDSLLIFKLLTDGYKEIGEFEKSIQFAKKAIRIKTEKELIRKVLIIYADALIETKDSTNIQDGIKSLDSLEIIYFKNSDSFNLSRVKNRLGNAFNYLNQPDKSIKFYKEALELQEEDALKAILCGNIATAFTDQNSFNFALEYLNRALRLNKDYFGSRFNYMYASNYENFGDYYIKQNLIDSSLISYQKALINLTNNFRNENIFQNPCPKDKNLFIYSTPDMIRVLHLKARAAFQYYKHSDSLKYLNLANQTYQTTFDFHDKLQKEISTENSRLFQAKNIMHYLENALKVAFELEQNGQDIGEAAFRFMEKNKATVLLQSMNEAYALQFANLPKSLIEQEKDIKIAISFQQKQLNEIVESGDSAKIVQFENVLFEEKQQYNQLIDNLENNYPSYYRLKYEQNETELADIQNQLNQKKAILEYFVGDSSIYALTIQKNKSHLYQFLKPQNWNLIMNDFLSTIDAEEVIKNDEYNAELYQKFLKNASTLFNFLLEQPLKDLGENITHLQIIPDGELSYIPFGLLLTNTKSKDTGDYRNLHYLLKEKTISYAYSAALLLENKTGSEENYTYNYAGFAPDYKNSKYQSLSNTNQSVQNISKSFKGISYINNEATKINFKENADQFKIFQLAMHGIVDDDEPLNSKLIFTNDSLEAYELYNMEILAELGVLSACETGIGKEAKGEGIMSLSRAFTYAGCNSLVMSLWSIEDGSTAKIVENFFHHLKKGKTKDEALRQAKLDFLQHTKTEFTHPIYWAGLVQSGNTSSIDFGNCNFWYWLILVIVILLLLTKWFHIKRKNRKPRTALYD